MIVTPISISPTLFRLMAFETNEGSLLRELQEIVVEEGFANYKILGVNLDLPAYHLKVIEGNYPKDTSQAIFEVLCLWLKQCPKNPKKTLLEAIRKSKNQANAISLTSTNKSESKDNRCYSITGLLLLLAVVVAMISMVWPETFFTSDTRPNNLTLHPIPDDDREFVGREENVSSLLQWLNFSSNVRAVGVFGSPGIGKSHLAREIARMIQKQGDVTVEYYDLKDIVSVSSLQQSITNRSQLPLMTWAQLVTRKTILLFDNCDELIDSEQTSLQLLMENLVRYSNHHIKLLYTSQRMITTTSLNVKALTLIKLTVSDSVEVLQSWCPYLDLYEAKQVASLCSNIPMALQIAGATIAIEQCHANEFIADLNEDYEGYALSQDILPTQQRMVPILEYSFKRLGDFHQSCGSLLAHFPGSFNREAAIEVIKSLNQFLKNHENHMNNSDLVAKPSSCLQQLRHRSWLNYHTNTERYSLHSLLYGFLRQLPDTKRLVSTKETESLFNSSFATHFRKHWVKFLQYEFEVLSGYKQPSTSSSDIREASNEQYKLLNTEKHNLHHAGKIFLDNSEITKNLVTSSEAFKNMTDNLLTQDSTWWLLLYLFNKPQNENTRSEVGRTLPLYRTTVTSLEFHQYQFVNEIGIEKYLNSYIEAVVQVSALEEFINGPEMSVEYILSKQIIIEELHEKFGQTVNMTRSVTCYYNSLMMFAVIGFSINTTMPLILSKLPSLSHNSNPCQSKHRSCSNYLMGFSYIAERDYLKAAAAIESSIPSKESLKINAQHLHSLILIYYCYQFVGDKHAAVEALKRHSEPSLEKLAEDNMTSLTSTYMTILFHLFNELGVEPPLSPLPAIAEKIKAFNETGTVTPVTFLNKR